jgi:hypothetical protein
MVYYVIAVLGQPITNHDGISAPIVTLIISRLHPT